MGVALYIGFLVTFFLDATGVELHQWIGLFIGFLVLVHLVLHIDWVAMVTTKFFGDISNSARVNLILDAGLGLGFFSIIFTGIVMSTWLNLTIIDYAAWSNIHTLLSVVTLFALMLKIILHRKWIVCTAEKYIFKRTPKKVLEPVIAIQPTATRVNRREFLKVGAVVGVGTIIGVTHIHKVFEDIISENTAIGSTQAGGGLASTISGESFGATSSKYTGSGDTTDKHARDSAYCRSNGAAHGRPDSGGGKQPTRCCLPDTMPQRVFISRPLQALH